jgi:hypothetical protein
VRLALVPLFVLFEFNLRRQLARKTDRRVVIHRGFPLAGVASIRERDDIRMRIHDMLLPSGV